jgi:hypothetical protein
LLEIDFGIITTQHNISTIANVRTHENMEFLFEKYGTLLKDAF